MSQIKFDKKNLINVLFFLVIPIFGFAYSFYNLFSNQNRKIAFFVISAFCSLFILKNPPIHDIYRYALRFDSINSIKDFGIYTNDYFFDFIVVLFKNLDIPFFLIPPLFVGLSIYLILNSINNLLLKLNISPSKSVLIIIFTLILANPITISLGLRSHLAFSFFLYGIINFVIYKKKSYFIFLILAPLTHSASILLVIAFFATLLFKPKILLTTAVSATLFTVSKSLLLVLASTTFISTYFGTLTTYTEFDNLSDKSNNGMLYYYITNFIKILVALAYIKFSIFQFSKIKTDIKENKIKYFLYYFTNNIIILSFATSMSEIAFGRYSSYAIFFMCILMIIYNKNKIINVFLTLFFIYTFTIGNIFINRNILKTNDFEKIIIIPPIINFTYSDEEYRKKLSNTDVNGYPISGPGSL